MRPRVRRARHPGQRHPARRVRACRPCVLLSPHLALSSPLLELTLPPSPAEQVLDLIEVQLAKVPTHQVQALILVGGFAASEYLCSRVHETFSSRIPVIAKPRDTDVATLQGAARYGLGLIGGKATVSSVISPRCVLLLVAHVRARD